MKIAIKCFDGWKEVEATEIGCYGIFAARRPTFGEGWVVNHIDTGTKLGGWFSTLRACEEYVDRLEELEEHEPGIWDFTNHERLTKAHKVKLFVAASASDYYTEEVA